MTSSLSRARAVFLGVVLVAAGLRLWGLGAQGLWADEAGTAQWAGLPWGTLWARLAGDNQAPLFILVCRALSVGVGEGPTSAEEVWRLPSALASLGSVALLPWAVGPAVGTRAALWAAGALGVHAVSVHYAREAKPYALVMFIFVLALGLGWRVARQSGRAVPWAAAGWALALALLMYAHNAAVPFAGVLGVVALLGAATPRNRVWVFVAGVAGVLLYLPWLPLVASQVDSMSRSYAWFGPAFQQQFPWQVPMSLAVTALGAPPPIRNGTDHVGDLNAALALLQVAAVAAAAWWVRGTRRVLAALVVLGVVPATALFAASSVGAPFYVVGRVDVALVPLWCVALGVVVEAARSGAAARAVSVGVAALVLGALGPLWMELGMDTRSQERTIARALMAAMAPGDVLVVATAHRDTMAYYLGRHRPDTTVRAYPSSREDNAFHVPAMDGPALSADARSVLDRAGTEASARAGVALWFLTQPGPEADALLTEATQRHGRGATKELGFLGLMVNRMALVRPVPSDAPPPRSP